MAPSTLVGWKPALWMSFGATRLSRHIVSTPDGDAEQRGAAVAAEALARGEHRRHDHRAAVHRAALEGVVEILAVRGGAVDHRRILGAEAARVPERGAGPAAVDAARSARARNRVLRAATHRPATSISRSSQRARTVRAVCARPRASATRSASRSATDCAGATPSPRSQRTILTPASFRISRMRSVNSS